MIWHTFIDDETGEQIMELDADGIDWFIQGLEQLKHSEPGEEVTTPAFENDPETGMPIAATTTVLRRLADPPPEHPDYSDSI